MKRAIVGSAVAAVCLALVVTAAIVPAPAEAVREPTHADLERFAQRMLDATWESTGLPGEHPPVVYTDLEIPPQDTYGSPLSDCMTDNGMNLESWGWGPDEGYTLLTMDGSDQIDDASQRQWYECVAQNPIDSSAAFLLYTPSQRGALYDYQIEQLAPCLTLLGYDVTVPHSRAQAMTSDESLAQWTAFEAVWSSAAGYDRFTDVVAICGEPYMTL